METNQLNHVLTLQNGNCNKGRECTFLHESVRQVQSPKQPVQVSSSKELELQLQIAELKLQLALASGQSRQQSQQAPYKPFSSLSRGGGEDNVRK